MTIQVLAARSPAQLWLELHSTKTHHVMRPNLILPITAGLALLALAAGLLHPSTDSALARCENRGGSVAECRLLVLGR